MKDFRNLKVWEKAHHLALTLYPVTASFPRDETFGLASQIRRAASSIPSNIAEGCADKETPNWLASALLLEVPPANWSINSCWLEI